MADSSQAPGSNSDIPTPPDVCSEEDCNSTKFISRSRPPAKTDSDEKEYVFSHHECDECGEKYNDRSPNLLNESDPRAPSWQEIFGHPQPYSHQKDAIKDIIDTSSSRGFSVIEGGCGTGKTMIALTAALTLIKNPNVHFNQVMVLTSVKQQLRQFEEDLKVINQNLPEDISAARAVTLVGKTDLCPYAREEKAGITKQNVAGECRRLRDQTSKLMGSGHDGTELAQHSVNKTSQSQWDTAGEQVPYSDQLPQKGIDYCPFYANYKENKDPLFTFGHAPDCILHPDEIVKQSVRKGVCPHSAMSTLCNDADVVIANYYHAFDENTRRITNNIIDTDTLLVCDEAHMIEPRVRGILSKSVQHFMIERAASEIGAIHNSLFSNDKIDLPFPVSEPPENIAKSEMAGEQLDEDALKDLHGILQQFNTVFYDIVQQYLTDNHSNWNGDLSEIDDNIEIPLRDPTQPEEDRISEWIESKGIPPTAIQYLNQTSGTVSDVLSESSNTGSTNQSITDVASLLNEWIQRDNTQYFRSITLSKRDDIDSAKRGWKQAFSATIELNNVMPRKVISSTLQQFGAGILMSATLAPLDVYREVIGLDYVCEVEQRSVKNSVYTADFPEDNRLSVSLDLPKFTSDNRGSITDNTETRKQYAKAIQIVSRTTPGNVLVCMPSYKEAKWAASLLDQSQNVSKEVLVDESSSEKETKRLKQYFIDGEPKVLVTSLRGTLTEGVDYDGDKLLGCIVCGVPIENIGSPRTKAVRTAYEDKFGGVGFHYGLTVPAVRKTRQALGRVIRGTSDVGVRVVADKRYTGSGQGTVRHYMSQQEQNEYEVIDDVESLSNRIKQFW